MDPVAAALLIASMHCKMSNMEKALRWECGNRNPWGLVKAPNSLKKRN